MGWASARIRANGGATRVKKNVRLVEPETFPESKHFPELPIAEGYNGIGRALIKRNRDGCSRFSKGGFVKMIKM
jgi:hypothetical protein